MNLTSMDTDKFIDYLIVQGFEFKVSDDKLQCINKGNLILSEELRSQLRVRKNKIISILRVRDATFQDRKIITPISNKNDLMLSSMQERLFFINNFDESSGSIYNIPTAFLLTGKLNAKALEKAINKVVSRHEILRSYYVMKDYKPIIKIKEYFPFELMIQSATKKEANHIINVLSYTKFSLGDAPLYLFRLIKIKDDEHILFMNFHHIICDGWSLKIILSEMSNYYLDFLNDHNDDTVLPIINYLDYASWEINQKSTLEAQDYWKGVVADYEPLNLLLETSITPVNTMHGKHYNFSINSLDYKRLKNIASQNQLSIYSILLAAFKFLLNIYSQQNDILIGTVYANREMNVVQDMVGFFANTLPIRTVFNDEWPFVELAKEINICSLESISHQSTPLQKIIEFSNVKRDNSSNNLFDTMFVFQSDSENVEMQLPNVTVEEIETGYEAVKFGLTLHCREQENGLIGCFQYNQDTFKLDRIKEFSSLYKRIISQIIENPNKRLKNFTILDDKNQTRLIYDWNHTDKPFCQDPIISVFENIVRQSPQAIALSSAENVLSYIELNSLANQLAHLLLSQVSTVQSHLGSILIGIGLGNGENAIIAMLACLKIGAAYVPLDPEYPLERLQYMVADSKIDFLLTDDIFCKKFQWDKFEGQYKIVNISNANISSYSCSNPSIPLDINSLMYVIYTSGSTGQPKGVMVQQKGVLNLVYAQMQEFGITSLSRVIQYASVSFDAAISEIFTALLGGSALYIPDAQTRKDVDALHAFLLSREITVATIPPALLAVMPKNQLPLLETLVVAGDMCDYQTVQFWSQDRRFINAYGPTENSVCATMSIYDSNKKVNDIGSAIQNCKLYVLDNNLRPLPIGVPGELYIGGVGVAQGYLNQVALTKEKFLVNPFENNARIYKTGDRVRWLPSGSIEFLGRIDNQVKIRGYRVELGEIESCLNSINGIKQCAIICEEKETQKRLVAYYTLNKNTILSTTTLREKLASIIPFYMMPAVFIELDEFPLTPSNKINRKLLPASKDYESIQDRNLILPRNTIEQHLAEIWQDVLDIKIIGVDENFFMLGGDSIMSIQIVARAKSKGIVLTPKDLFLHGTIAELALISQQQTQSKINQAEMSGDMNLSPIQHWFLSKDFVEKNHFNQSFMIDIKKPINVNMLNMALSWLVKHHDALRIRLIVTPEEKKQFYDKNSELSLFEVHEYNLSGLSKFEMKNKIKSCNKNLAESLNIEQGPVIKCGLYQCGDLHQKLFIVIHHFVVDGVSWRIILDDLAKLLEESSENNPLVLSEKSHSYFYWLKELNVALEKKYFDPQWDYWLKIGKSVKPFINIADKGLSTYADLGQVKIRFDKNITHRLLKQANRAYQTRINDLLLTALLMAYHEWVGEHSLLLHLENHGRELANSKIDLSRTVGWFTSLYPVELSSSDAKSTDYSKLIMQVKEQLREIPDDGIGYGILRYLSGDDRVQVLEENDKALVGFNYLGIFNGDNTLLAMNTELAAAFTSPRNKLIHLLEFNGMVFNNELEFTLSYSQKHFLESKITNFADLYYNALVALIDHCCSQEKISYTPSDFPLAKITQAFINEYLQTVNFESVYGLSPLQKGFLFHALHSPTVDAYHTQLTWQYRTEININHLKKAWQVLVNNEQIFRASFAWNDLDEPIHIIHREVSLSWAEYDWSYLSEKEQNENLSELLSKDRTLPFDLTMPSPMRLYLIRLAENNYAFVFSCHHIIIDGWCVPVLLERVHDYYQNAISSNNISYFSPKYESYIKWLVEQNRSEACKFWRDLLVGFTGPTPLVVNHQPLNVHKSIKNHREQEHVFSEELLSASVDFSKKNQITFNCLMQMAWAAVLMKYNHTTDVTLGVTVSGRPADLVAVEDIIGPFINTLPIRVKINNSRSVIDELKEFNILVQDAIKYGYLGLNEIAEITANQNSQPFFYNLFIYENYPARHSLKEIELFNMKANEKTNYPLTITIVHDDALRLIISYDEEIFQALYIKNMLIHLETALRWIISNPNENFADVSIINPVELKQLIYQENQTEVDFPDKATIHELFEEQVCHTPQQIALVSSNQKMTYQELNANANQLAIFLRHNYPMIFNKLDNSEYSMVGLCINRGVSMMVALMAILKSGAAYVPIDPQYPQERLNYMINDSGLKVLITDKDTLKDAPFLINNAIHIIVLEDIIELLKTYSTENIKQINSSHQLAYVIYTSGSTGNPKGVLIPHQGVCNLAKTTASALGIIPSARVLQFSSICFDTSVQEWALSLLNGAELHVLSKYEMPPHKSIGDLLEVRKINVAMFPPAILEISPVKSLPELKVIISGGDTCQPKTVEKWAAAGRIFINDFGPTEATVCVSMTKCEIGKKITIGKPHPNTKLYVLDENLKPVPLGIPGELCISGVGLAHGYYKRPDLTGDRFINNPFIEDAVNAEHYNRMYKTGDLVRWLPNGEIEHLGRIDHQVKIRGYRIELGEIELKINAYPDVAQACVVALESNGQKYLAAYFTMKEVNHSQSIKYELDAYLKSILPKYMVPAVYIELSALPLTPSEKINRKELPEPQDSDFMHLAAYEAPVNDIEEKICKIWGSILKVHKISRHDNFFELGGDSIKVIQVIARLHEYELNISPKDLFDFPTIAGIADKVLTFSPINTRQDRLEGQFGLIPIQNWFFNNYQKNVHHWNQAFLLRLNSYFTKEKIKKIFNKIIEHHDTLRLRFIKISDDTWTQYYSNDSHSISPLIEEVDLSMVSQLEQDNFIYDKCTDLHKKININDGPTLVLGLFNNHNDGKQRLLITIHHLLIDAVSWSILFNDLNTLISSIDKEKNFVLPLKTSSYQDWHQVLYSDENINNFKKQFPYWNQLFDKVEPSIRITNQYSECKQIVSRVTKTVTQKLLELSRVLDFKLDEILLTAITSAFCEWSKDPNLFLELEGHGREYQGMNVDLSRTLGWFTSLYPVVLTIDRKLGFQSDNIDWLFHLNCIKNQLRSVPNKGLGYGIIKNLLDEKHHDKSPKISFNYLGSWGDVSNKDNFEILLNQAGQSYSTDQKSPYWLEINSYLENDELLLDFMVKGNANLFEQFDAFIKSLLDVLAEISTYFTQYLKNKSLLSKFQSKPLIGYQPVWRYNEAGSLPRLFFIHPAGGGAAFYTDFANLFAAEQPFYAIDSYNLHCRQHGLATIQDLAKYYLAQIFMIQSSGPYYLGGYSMGGQIAFEIATLLREAGHHVEIVYLIDTSLWNNMDRILLASMDKKIDELMLHQSPLYHQLPKNYLQRLLELAALERNAIASHCPQNYSGNVMLFKATELLADIQEPSLRQYNTIGHRHFSEPYNGWDSLVKNISRISITGDHSSIMKADSLKKIADIVQEDIRSRCGKCSISKQEMVSLLEI